MPTEVSCRSRRRSSNGRFRVYYDRISPSAKKTSCSGRLWHGSCRGIYKRREPPETCIRVNRSACQSEWVAHHLSHTVVGKGEHPCLTARCGAFWLLQYWP